MLLYISPRYQASPIHTRTLEVNDAHLDILLETIASAKPNKHFNRKPFNGVLAISEPLAAIVHPNCLNPIFKVIVDDEESGDRIMVRGVLLTKDGRYVPSISSISINSPLLEDAFLVHHMRDECSFKHGYVTAQGILDAYNGCTPATVADGKWHFTSARQALAIHILRELSRLTKDMSADHPLPDYLTNDYMDALEEEIIDMLANVTTDVNGLPLPVKNKLREMNIFVSNDFKISSARGCNLFNFGPVAAAVRTSTPNAIDDIALKLTPFIEMCKQLTNVQVGA